MNAAYIALIPLGVLAVCIVLFAAGIVFSDRNSSERKSKASSEDPDDGDEYISLAPTMSVRQIFRAYTRNPSEAEQKYTDRPLNVTGLITRITDGGKYSHVELDEKFICICPQGSVRNLRPLQKVCITGTLRGKFLLDNCVMIKHPM